MNYEHFNNNGKNIFLVDMKQEKDKIFSELSSKGISKYLKNGKRIGIIVNKKGYSSGIMCQDCGNAPKCDNCDIPIAFHKDNSGEYFGLCHICKKQYNMIGKCNKCGSNSVDFYGSGTQKIQEMITSQFGIKPVIIESETVNSPNKIKSIYESITQSKIIIGTSLLTTPPKGIIFDLIVFMNADIGLNIPDFNSNYNNFLFLFETFVNHRCENFIVQSFNPTSYSIINACKMDLESFKLQEMQFRNDFGYPPYKELCVILYKNEIEEKLFNKVNSLYQELLFLKEKYGMKDMEVHSTPPMIYKIFGKYRYNIIIKGENIREFIDIAYSKLKIQSKGFKLDRNPKNLI